MLDVALIENAEGDWGQSIQRMWMYHEGWGDVGREQLRGFSDEEVGEGHLISFVEVYLYGFDEFWFDKALVIVYIHLN